MKALIYYGTRYGATKTTVGEIAKTLEEEGLSVMVVNAQEEKIKSIAEFELVIVGSGMKIERWVGKVEGFLKKFSDELKTKKVALFVSSGGLALMEYKGEHGEIERITKKYLEDKASKYGLIPISMTIFGGVWDYNQISKIFKKFLDSERENFIAAGIPETEPGVYDTRNWEQIRNWARELVKKI